MRKNFGASMEASMVEKKKEEKHRGRRKSFWNFLNGEREDLGCFKKKDFLFFFLFFFSKSTCHMSSFKWSKRAHPFPLIWIHTQPQRRKIWPFGCWNPASVCVSPLWFQFLVFLCTRRGPFLNVGNIYQNAQNETLSVVQRLVLLNFKLHPKQ